MTTFPDLPAHVISVLAASHGSATVSTDLTGYQAGMEWIEVAESPGREIVRNRLIAPVFDFNVYGATIESTRQLAMAAMNTISHLTVVSASDLVVTKVDIDITPFKFTDLVNNRPRYIFTATIYYRPR